MPRLALFTGIILVLLGFIFFTLAYNEDGKASFTALIPSIIGILIAAGGVIAQHPARVKAGMHAAAGFALLGLLGSLRGAPKWPALLTGQEVTLPLAAWAMLLTFLICGVFVARCVKWFIDNRRAKAAQA